MSIALVKQDIKGSIGHFCFSISKSTFLMCLKFVSYTYFVLIRYFLFQITFSVERYRMMNAMYWCDSRNLRKGFYLRRYVFILRGHGEKLCPAFLFLIYPTLRGPAFFYQFVLGFFLHKLSSWLFFCIVSHPGFFFSKLLPLLFFIQLSSQTLIQIK